MRLLLRLLMKMFFQWRREQDRQQRRGGPANRP